MSTARKNPVCLDCGCPVGRWTRWCADCMLVRRAQQKADRRELARSGHFRCMDCNAPIGSSYNHRCRVCAGKRNQESFARRAALARFGWWHDAPPVSGYAISAPGGMPWELY